MKVDFPEPEGPMRATNSPFRISRSTPPHRPHHLRPQPIVLPDPFGPDDQVAHRSLPSSASSCARATA